MSQLDVIILAAGKGTRMKTVKAKVLHKVCGLTLIERTIRTISALKPKKTIVVVGYQSQVVSDEAHKTSNSLTFDDSANTPALDLQTITQEPQNGTGHAIQVAAIAFSPASADISSQYCLILPGDVPLLKASTLSNFIDLCLKQETTVGLLSFSPKSPAGFGRVVRNRKGQVVQVVEDRDCSDEQRAISEVNSSIYLAKKDFLLSALSKLQANNSQKELYLPDIVKIAFELGKDTFALLHEDAQEMAGANSVSELYELEKLRRKEITEHWMARGVTFENPESAYIDEDAIIESDCFIGANTRIIGQTTVKHRSTIDGDCRIEDSFIDEESHIKLGVCIEHSHIGKNCSVGPFAHLRPQTLLESGVKVGNFVEIKKSTLHQGVKAGHLTYLGDAEVGQETNIGAGTITCNYDGSSKNKTQIGDSTFIGSNSALVAPVKIGIGAYIGAGSTITSDVPDYALALGRERQVNIENWAKSRSKV